MRASGLDQWLLGLVKWDAMGLVMLAANLCLGSVAMSTFISNSATANLIIPIGLSLAQTAGVTISPTVAAAFIAISCSMAMALPVSTPPNAIAHSTGAIRTGDMAVAGVVIGGVGCALLILVAPWLWRLVGVIPGG